MSDPYEVPELTPGLYPFHEDRIPLSDLTMVETPTDLQALLVEQAARQGVEILRGVAVELRCPSEAAPDSAFLIFWPLGDGPMHMLAPRRFAQGRG